MTVEVIWPHIFPKHDVIVEVDELLGQAWDPVDVCFNGRRTEGGKVSKVLEDILHKQGMTSHGIL